MKLRSCDTAHFIQTIRGGVVLKVCNIISHERPVIRSKKLKDVYESEDTERLQKPPSALVFDQQRVKQEGPYFLWADRTLREIKSETDEFASHADDDLAGGLDDDTTLNQLKKRLSKRKRKYIPLNEISPRDNANEKAVQDESDLNEPIISWKAKHSKTSKTKRKCLKMHVVSPSTTDIAIKSEEDLVSEFSSEGLGSAPVVVKVEVPDAEQLEWQNKISSCDPSSSGHNEVPNPAQKTILNEVSLCVDTYGNCVTNEVSYDLEDVQPISVILPGDEAIAEFETLETNCRNSPDFPSEEIEKQQGVQDSHPCRELLSEDPNPDLSSHSRCSTSVENMPEESISGTQVPDMAIVGCMGLQQECNSLLSEGITEADMPYESNYSLTSLDKNCGSNLDSVPPSKTEHIQTSMDDVVSNKKQPSACSIISNELNCEDHVEDESLKAADNQNSSFTMTGAGNEDSLEHMTCDSAETTLLPEPHQPPERLLSTRKALSPSSQKQLRMAMNSNDICNNSSQNIVLECKEKLFETEKNGPNDEVMVNSRRPGKVTQRKVNTSPRRTIRKSQIAKGNLEGPRFSRALPNISTACTSVQGCSEGAIAFSQRQLHDMETLAEKLMNELKSMKDIVEQKLLFEAYRNVSIKNDADEVKSAIHNATKVEETAKRWISMMARDCTRFCKIMKLTPESPTATKGSSPGEKRKIMFADEAGRELCHVRFFDIGVVAPEGESDAVKK